jgi:hypothetical protein
VEVEQVMDLFRSRRWIRNSYYKQQPAPTYSVSIRRLVTAMSIQFQETGNVDTYSNSISRLFSSSRGGGGGGATSGGGGGAGGHRTSFPGGTKIALEIGGSSTPITIGAGGAGGFRVLGTQGTVIQFFQQ